jgi:hypothetical protein
MKVGFGLWHWRDISLAAEFVTLFAGLWVLLRYAPVEDRNANIRLWALAGWLVLAQLFATFGPQPATPRIAAAMALGGYTVFALFAWQVDRARAGRKPREFPYCSQVIDFKVIMTNPRPPAPD